MWTNFFSDIVVVSLRSRKDRRARVKQDMNKYNIPFSVLPAVYDPLNGAKGLCDTMKLVFDYLVKIDCGNVLIFEDDVEFIKNPNIHIAPAISELPSDWMQLYLGLNAFGGLVHYSDNLFSVKNAYSSHAIAFSKDCVRMIVKEEYIPYPLDQFYVDKIQSMGKSFCTNPLICSQYNGYSDIEKRETNYKRLIEDRYEEQLKKA